MAEMPRSAGLAIVSGSTYPEFADQVAAHPYLHTNATGVERRTFSNGELFVRYEDSLRGKDVFVFQAHHSQSTQRAEWSINEAIQEQVFMVDAAKGASAAHVTAICPYFGYSRQDKKADGRTSIAARQVAHQLIEAGAERIISMDLHSAQIQGFTPKKEPFENIYASPVLLGRIQEWAADKNRDEIVVVAPDEGSVKLNGRYKTALGVEMAIIDKKRSADSSKVQAASILGEIAGKHCIFVDDMIDTAKTLRASADIVMERGAKSVIAAATHGIFSGDAYQYLEDSPFEQIIVADTIPQIENQRHIRQLKVATVTEIFADVIRRIYFDDSVSEVFEGHQI